ncbi:hypothetical protein GAYE_SCF78G7094 [Galdieria yellowstonensis]|uniref:Uncharacterized protein n=1 Tax=Galdieria yellowstonensis TaxID=3028027 RepID=A0AAV9ILV7_9RHOD|nr:hypothetical protein GAYE_SCF54G6184 [Galdieria yellowstonensis]KAK4529142.1 hypothetical protein GAYE_SCF78G7094 [Galdieria yellowstonensis]
MDAASSRMKRACGIHMKWEHVFDPVTMKIDRKYADVWLEDLPDLSVESSETKVSELFGKRVKIGSEEFSTENTSLEAAASILLPKKFGEGFLLKSCGSRISRVCLRQDLINLWNALVDEENTNLLNILSDASGLGKSIYLHLIAVFARHFGILVQYIGNTVDLLHEKVDYKLVARKYAAMLLFMNSDTLDSLKLFYSGRPCYDFLQGFAIKFVAYYAFVKGDLVLCGELRRNFMNMKPRNLLIIDEHNAFWQKFGSDPNTWLPFFEFYADPVGHATWECKFVIATLQIHEFKLPSGYRNSKRYIEQLSKEEFKIWQALDDYPETFRDNESTAVDCTGFVPGMIAELIGMSRSLPNLSFGEVAARFYEECYADMQIVHSEYIKSLTHEVDKKQLYDGLHKLFRGRETPAITLFDSAYRDRGLLIAMNDGSLQFYNSIACDILYESFSNYYVTKERILELSKRFKESQMADADGGEF